MSTKRTEPPIYERRIEVILTSHVALLQAMDLRGDTIRSLAARSGVSKSTIGNLASGMRRSVRPATARQIAEALQLDVNDLFVARIVHTACRVPERVRRAA